MLNLIPGAAKKPAAPFAVLMDDWGVWWPAPGNYHPPPCVAFALFGAVQKLDDACTACLSLQYLGNVHLRRPVGSFIVCKDFADVHSANWLSNAPQENSLADLITIGGRRPRTLPLIWNR